MRPSNLENSHSHSQILRAFENEGSVRVRELARVTLENSQSLRTRMRLNLKTLEIQGENEGVIFKDSRVILENFPFRK